MKYCLVIGANSDIAKAAIRELAKEGYSFYLASRDIENLDRFAKDLKVHFPHIEVFTYKFDVCNLEDHKKFLQSLPAKPEGVIISVGYLTRDYNLKYLNKELIPTINVNFLCPSHFVLIFVQYMLEEKNKKEKWIVGISSVAGDRSRRTNFLYASAKSGFSQFLDGLRMFLESNEDTSFIKIITVKPGFVRTKMTEKIEFPSFLAASPEEVAKDIVKAIKKRKKTVYTPWYWRIIMFFIKILPESILRKLKN